jgi:protease-4
MVEQTSAPANPPSRTVKKSVVRRSRGVTWLLLGITLFVLLIFAGATGLAYLLISQSGNVEVEEGSYLKVTLSGQITDAPIAGGIFQEPSDFPLTATDMASVVRHAATDDRIAGIYLNLRSPSMGWGLAREIRTALVDFKESGKPCIAYSEVYMTKDYYVASACDQVLMAPAGIAYIAGMESTVTYYRDALEKVGVRPQFVHVGEYKTAIEPFERTSPSQAAIESNEALLESMYSLIVEEIAQSRELSTEQVRQAIDSLKMTPQGVIESGLIDGLAYPDALSTHIDTYGEEGWSERLVDVSEDSESTGPQYVSAKKYRQNVELTVENAEGTIAIVYAEGVILSGQGEEGLFGSAGLFDGRYREWMAEARDDKAVKAVVIRVNSPGGSALASDFMWREVALTKAMGKPVVISMADYAASGGYMMSCNADWIVAQPTTITGSIGVFGQFFSLTGTYEKLGLTEHTFKRGVRADLLTHMDDFEADERAILQSWVEDTYGDFVGQVADGRGRSVEEVEPVAQGRVWTGQQALADSHHLVDELGGLDVALAKAAELSGLSIYSQKKIPEQKGFVEVFLEEMTEAKVDVSVRLPIELPMADALIKEVQVMQNIEENGRIGAYLPGWN